MRDVKYLLLLILITLFINACSSKKAIPELLKNNYKANTIYFEEPKPGLDLEGDNLKEILVLLHARVDAEKIKEHFNMNDSVWNERLNILFGEGLIKKSNDGVFLPTCFVLDNDEAATLKKFTDSLGTKMSGIVIDRLPQVKHAYNSITSFSRLPFDNVSMFILGAVLHDKWQMNLYHDQFIKAFAPHRGAASYYLALIQNDEVMNPVIPIYETKFYDYTDFQFGTFAHTGTERAIVTFATSELIKNFGKDPTVSDSVFQIALINEMVKLNKNPNYKIQQNILNGFEVSGLVLNSKPTVAFVSKADQGKLNNLTSVIESDIVRFFEERQTLFVKHYLNSPYREETSYKEWMMWLYKLITAKTIDVLIQRSIIKEPVGRTASFIFEK